MQEQALERAEGSLPFPFLDDEASVEAYRESRTLFIMRGLPGSGKSALANTIAEKYKGICRVISADHKKVRPEVCPALPEKYKELDEEARRCCQEGVAVVVIDDTNHQWGRLEKLFDIASEYQYLALFVEPKTPWKKDCAVLEKMTQWELPQSELEDLRGSLEEPVYPLFYGWFLTRKSQCHTKETGKKLLEALGELDEFKEHWADFGGAASEKGINLEEYFDGKGGILHCTTKFSDYGKAKGAQEYAELEAVKEFYSSAFHLQISGLFITPRTAGARVRLSDKQLEVWPDSEKEAMPSEELPRGSQAHITLGCAKDVEPVQTGLDLLEFIKLEKVGDQDWAVKDTDQGKLCYFGKGMWMLELSEEVTVKTVFGGFYPKEEGGEEAGVEVKVGEERAVEKEGEERAVEKVGEERAVEKVGEERAVEKEGEERAVEKVGEERAVVKEGEERAVEKVGEERAVVKEGEERAVEKEGEERAVEKVGEERAVEKVGEERAVEKVGEERAVEKEGEERAVEKEGEERAVEKEVEKEGEERAVVKEGEERAVEKVGEERAVEKEGEERVEEGEERAVEKDVEEKVEKEGEERAVEIVVEEKAVEKVGEERAVEKEGEERVEEGEERAVEKDVEEKVEKEGEEKAVEKEGEERAVEKEGEERAVEKDVEEKVEKEGEERAVEKVVEEKAVEKEGEERVVEKGEERVEEKGEGKEKENQQEGKPATGKKKGKCTVM
ncbi:2',3'-cyclic-nucleotide 3'-phosphodiesterase-like [Polyodon spathula]|uniref:2',3'-cyclic-nucleotide 3'-phosphodiesterase-like n=1 Tax=Polyodon spathula TaxID=7913 RepID=UPI001B7DF10A|nr:2',3'-cyclic-nucleotide 3'-phosphodiesterase-like [Polyodon spathula]